MSHRLFDETILRDCRARICGVLALAGLALSACGGGSGGNGNGGSPGQFRFANTTATIGEAAGNAIVTIERTGTRGAVSVAVTSANGSATAGEDYTALTTRINFADGDATPKTVTVAITNDTSAEPDETLSVTLSDPTGGATLQSPSSSTMTVVINDDDNGDGGDGNVHGLLRFSGKTLTVTEGASATANLIVERVGGTRGIVSVAVMSADGTAKEGFDYTAVTTRVSFEDGDATPKTVSLPITNDTTPEADETLTVTLSNPMGGATIRNAPDSTATITIHDNDQPGAASLSTSTGVKRLFFQWRPVPNAVSYRLMRRLAPTADFVPVSADVAADPAAVSQSTMLDIPVHLYPWTGAVPDYRLDSCTSVSCTPSNIVTHNQVWSVPATGYVKASDTSEGARFGSSVAVSADGKTVAIGAPFANGEAGAVYIYLAKVSGPSLAPNPVRILAPSPQAMHFGASVAISEDGNTLVVGAPFDSNSQTGVRTYPAAPNLDAPHSGGVFVYTRNPGVPVTWSTPVYIKAPDADAGDEFGIAVALKDTALVVGAPRQDSPTTATADQTNSAVDSGAAYPFYASAGTWVLGNTVLKAVNVSNGDLFGSSVAVSRGGSIIIVGAPNTDVTASLVDAGAAYLFRRTDGGAEVPTWGLPLNLPALGVSTGDLYGAAVATSADGAVFAVGAPKGDDPNTAAMDAGAVYLYNSSSPPTIHLESVTATYPHGDAHFGSSLALNGDGTILAAGSPGESAEETGVGGRADAPLTLPGAGAVDVLTRQPDADWSAATKHYVKAVLADQGDQFGIAVGLSNDGFAMIVGADREDGDATSISGNSVPDSGAVYQY